MFQINEEEEWGHVIGLGAPQPPDLNHYPDIESVFLTFLSEDAPNHLPGGWDTAMPALMDPDQLPPSLVRFTLNSPIEELGFPQPIAALLQARVTELDIWFTDTRDHIGLIIALMGTSGEAEAIAAEISRLILARSSRTLGVASKANLVLIFLSVPENRGPQTPQVFRELFAMGADLIH